MNQPKFKIHTQRVKGQQMEYDRISAVEVPPLEFPDQARAAAWQQAVKHFRSEFTKVQDLAIVSFGGRRGYGWDYKFYLVNSLIGYARQLGAPVKVETMRDAPIVRPVETRAPQESQTQKKLQEVTEERNKILGEMAG